uniref:RIKEN cDNA 1700018B08 gene n=2 Tax=Nannospalax galili TaxID=1026970 RepID=A0A8C6QNF4_NANGA
MSGLQAWLYPGRAHFRPLGRRRVSQVYPGLHTILQEGTCCQCYTRLGGCLPVPQAAAVLPYWVPLSLRPRKQVSRMMRYYVPRTIRSCSCPCHSFGGRLPMPRDQAVMPYWVPRGLRSQKKAEKTQENVKDTNECTLGSHGWHGCWQICGEEHLLFKWQRLQALHQDELLTPQEDELQADHPDPVLPISFNLLSLLNAILRVIMAIRQLFWG